MAQTEQPADPPGGTFFSDTLSEKRSSSVNVLTGALPDEDSRAQRGSDERRSQAGSPEQEFSSSTLLHETLPDEQSPDAVPQEEKPSDEPQATGNTPEHRQSLLRFQEILLDEQTGPSEKIQQLLELGAERLGLGGGQLAHIDLANAIHETVEIEGPRVPENFPTTSDLSTTYCRKALAEGKGLAIEQAEQQGWAEDPAYEKFGFSTYLGARVFAEGELYGTVCFADRTPREESFNEAETTFLTLLSEAIGQLLEQAAHQDESETQSPPQQPEQTQERLALRRLQRITADPEASFEKKIRWLLELGRDYLQLPYGYLSRISGKKERIVQSTGGHPRLKSGMVCPVSESHCQKLLQTDGVLAIHDTSTVEWGDRKAPRELGFGAYIGAEVQGDDELFGTFCFAGPEPRAEPFKEGEQVFLELLSQWASGEIEKRQAKKRLKEKNDRLDRFASVLSHDLRNPLHVAMMRHELAQAEDDPSHLNTLGEVLDRMDRLVEDVLTITRGSGEVRSEDLAPVRLSVVAQESWCHVKTPHADLRVDDECELRADEARLQRLLGARSKRGLS